MMTWHVVHAQLPPHACSSGMPRFLATSRNDSGLPWCEYGSWPCSNSTVCDSPSMMKVTLGILGLHVCYVPARQSRVNRPVHHHLGEVLRRIVERVRLLLDDFAIGSVEDALHIGERRLDPLALAGRQLRPRDVGELGCAQCLLGRLNHGFRFVARFDQK